MSAPSYADKRSEVLLAVGIDPCGSDDTVFGAEVYCDQHMQVHSSGWCTVSNIEKFFTDESRPRTSERAGRTVTTPSHPEWGRRDGAA